MYVDGVILIEKKMNATATALFVAYLRGYHATCDSPKIFDDNLAFQIIGKDVCTYYEQQYTNPRILWFLEHLGFPGATQITDKASALAMAMQGYSPLSLPVSRARFTEDKLEQAVEQGVRQYVILGAGLDTFAFRRSSMLKNLQVFEVDHPDMQEYKRQRIEELGWNIPEQLHFVPIDFMKESLNTALAKSSYDPQAPSFFSWLGVTYFLPRDTVYNTLSGIAKIAPAGSTIVFDYVHEDIFNPEKTSEVVQIGLRIRQQQGEPWITGFKPSEITKELESIGLNVRENLAPHDIQQKFFQERADRYCAYEHAHFISAITK